MKEAVTLRCPKCAAIIDAYVDLKSIAVSVSDRQQFLTIEFNQSIVQHDCPSKSNTQ